MGPVAAPVELDRHTGRADRVRAPLYTAGAVLAGTLAIHLRDPHESGSWGFCPWLVSTGFYCPGCGALRAVNDLTNFDVAAAASSNLLFVASIPLVVFFWARWLRRAWTGAPQDQLRGRRSSTRTGALIALMTVVMLVFAVLRNLPAGSWLAP